MNKSQKIFTAQQALFAMLLCKLDAKGLIDAEELCAVHASIGEQMPDPEMREAYRLIGHIFLGHVAKDRARRGIRMPDLQ